MRSNDGAASIAMAEEPPSSRHARFLARQPILDARQNVVAYELLFRSSMANAFSGDDDDSTRQVIDNILVVGAQELCSNTLAFVNCTREALVGRLVTLLPPEFTVLEVLETVKPDAEVVSACGKLKEMGYRIALDDFVPGEGMDRLIEMADYIKVDFLASDARERVQIRSGLRGKRAALLAEKIEDQQEFAVAVAEGFKYFQGYFFSRPKMMARDEVPRNHLNSINLLAALSRSPLNQKEIERLVLADAPLCFRLMRLVNSPIYGVRGNVQSVQRALIVVGEDAFRKLATVALAGSLGKGQPHALILLSLQRARFCELLAPHLKLDPVEQYLMGLLSLLDAILQTPMSAVVNMLPLEPSARGALLGEQNAAAVPLSIVKSYETGDWASSAAAEELFTLGADLLNGLSVEATRWAEAMLPS